ncbi:MAG: amidohydrolase family protein [Planctomycetota bacterium]|nr:amidohydrolase family protein [Planctomycetota bacterium]
MIVVDADSHIFEPDDLYVRFADPTEKDLVLRNPQYGLLEGTTPLGGPCELTNVVRPTGCAGMHESGGFDPIARLGDMDREGIGQMVCFPSVVTSLCRYPIEVESAMLSAYNNWIADFCSAAPNRLFAVAVVPLRSMERTITELRRRALDQCFVGITIPTRIPGRNLDDPYFDPLWSIAEELDLPILVHSGTARPPYPIGTSEQSNNFFLMHLMHHPTEQMLALSALIGGGVLDRFRRLRFGFFESGCGWVPWYLERIVDHARLLPNLVPRLRSDPRELVCGGRCFFSCDPQEISIDLFVTSIGPEALLYASDYPHWDSTFPRSVAQIALHPALDDSVKCMILERNARRLYTRLSGMAA